MKTIIIILISFSLSGQNDFKKFTSKHNEASHFYGSILSNEVTYQLQTFVKPEWGVGKKILVSNLFTTSLVFGKEFYDMRKRNPTGFSGMDIFFGCWGTVIFNMVKICVEHYKGNLNKNKYIYNSKWTFKNSNLL